MPTNLPQKNSAILDIFLSWEARHRMSNHFEGRALVLALLVFPAILRITLSLWWLLSNYSWKYFQRWFSDVHLLKLWRCWYHIFCLYISYVNKTPIMNVKKKMVNHDFWLNSRAVYRKGYVREDVVILKVRVQTCSMPNMVEILVDFLALPGFCE